MDLPQLPASPSNIENLRNILYRLPRPDEFSAEARWTGNRSLSDLALDEYAKKLGVAELRYRSGRTASEERVIITASKEQVLKFVEEQTSRAEAPYATGKSQVENSYPIIDAINWSSTDGKVTVRANLDTGDLIMNYSGRRPPYITRIEGSLPVDLTRTLRTNLRPGDSYREPIYIRDKASFSFEERVAMVLIEGGFVTSTKFEEARRIAYNSGVGLLDTLINQGMMAQETLTTVLSFQLRIPIVDLRHVQVDPEALRLVPYDYASNYRVLPVGFDPDDSLRVATLLPNDFQLSAELSAVTGRQIKFVLGLGGGLRDLINQSYGR